MCVLGGRAPYYKESKTDLQFHSTAILPDACCVSLPKRKFTSMKLFVRRLVGACAFGEDYDCVTLRPRASFGLYFQRFSALFFSAIIFQHPLQHEVIMVQNQFKSTMEPPRSPKTFSVSKLFSARKSAGNARKEALPGARARQVPDATS